MVIITLALLVVGVKNEKKKSVLVIKSYEDENDTENKARIKGELLNHFNKARGHGFTKEATTNETIQLSGNYFLPEAII